MTNIGSFRVGRRHGVVLLAILLILQLFAVAYFYSFFQQYGYLPSPFIDDKSNTFMDLFNTMFWAGRVGGYEIWKSVYPPLVFIILDVVRALLVPSFTYNTGTALRAGGYNVEIALVIAYCVLPALALCLRTWADFSLKERLLLYLAAVSSIPFLFALERGNLILLVTPLLTLLLGKSVRLRVLSLLLLINIKPYFGILLLGYVARKDWDELLIAVLVTGATYLATAAMIDVNFTSMLLNLVGFSQNANVFALRDIFSLPSSVSAFSAVLSAPRFIYSRYSTGWLNPLWLAGVINICKWGIIGWALTALLRAGRGVNIEVAFVVLIIVTTNIGIAAGGYSLIFYFALIPTLKNMRYAPMYFLMLAAIYVPLDPLFPLVRNNIGTQISFLAGHAVDVQWTVGLVTALRPWFNLLLLAAVAFELSGLRRQTVRCAVQLHEHHAKGVLNLTGDPDVN